MRGRTLSFLLIALGIGVLAPRAAAQDAAPPETVSAIAIPGGVSRALEILHDPVSPDPSAFLVEFIRRTYGTPIRGAADPRAAALQSLLAHIDRERDQPTSGATASPDMVPLPMSPAFWTAVVFGGRVAPDRLLEAILRSRDAALFYSALLSLDDDTRAWLATQPALTAEIVSRHAAAFLVAAPGLRVTGGAMRLPGGAAATEGWEGIVGAAAADPVAFIRGLLTRNDGRLAYVLSAIAQLTPSQIRCALGLALKTQADRIASLQRLAAIFDRLTVRWNVGQQTFWRPRFDPALLVADLAPAANGEPNLPGSRAFWDAIFDGKGREDPRALAGDVPAGFVWICEHVFGDGRFDASARYRAVLFASRIVARVTDATVRDEIDTVRGSMSYPALSAALERAKLADVTAFAAASRRAGRLAAIRDDLQAARSVAQFQGLIAILQRAAGRGSLLPGALAALVSSLSAVDVNARGEYEGRVARWIDAHLRPNSPALTRLKTSDGEQDDIDALAAGPVERDLLHLVAGATPREPPLVDWEGTRYRVDFAGAEGARLVRLLGSAAQPSLTSALSLVQSADALDGPGAGTAARRESADRRAHADEQLARGLMELVYATALGQPEPGSILAGEAAQRHDFGFRLPAEGRAAVWRLPNIQTVPGAGWHVSGSLLGLDVALADFSLLRIPLKPSLVKPTLDGGDRSAFIDAVALVEPFALSDTDRDAIVVAVHKGRVRVAALQTAADALAIADEIRLDPERRTLLAWTAAHYREDLGAFLSPGELLWLGAADVRRFQAWGALAAPRLGCLCLQITGPRPWHNVAGRWYEGMLASGFPDLNLRLAELLADLHMPAGLLPAVLASATLDLVETATSRDNDDRRGLVDFVNRLRRDRVEEYLALLTTGGPLVPTADLRQPRPSE